MGELTESDRSGTGTEGRSGRMMETGGAGVRVHFPVESDQKFLP